MTNVKSSSHKKRKRTRLEVTKGRITDKKSRPPGTPPRPVSTVTQSQTTLSQSPQALPGVGRNSTLLRPPNVRASPFSPTRGSPLADASAIADMASGNLLRNLHLDDDDNVLHGRRLYMDGADAITVVAPMDQTVHTTVDATMVNAATVDHSSGLRQHKKKIAKVDSCVLNDKIVFPWLRTRHASRRTQGRTEDEAKKRSSLLFSHQACHQFLRANYVQEKGEGAAREVYSPCSKK